ncbi:putative metal-dependent hydrolase YjjV [Thauera sp. GDN1]|uniref:TatD family hydrolase n=1 Tax=Thauera sp. GDN1 TaxID=2944810 RepID=UPI00247A4286|nr:TatD family hydrolase [Thauera sp. GDN1]WEN42361.1 putative metal-dependent hydrolase YjjV [Thauera sp. GDN1]
MLIDSHVHLDAAEFAPDRDEVMRAARAAGVQGFVVPAVDRGSFAAVRALAAAHCDVCPALGIHPLYVMDAHEDDLERLDEHLARGEARAVGEIGLDHFVTDIDPARQLDFFVAQLRLARRHDLPVILHVRRAVDAVLKQLRRIGVRGGIAHAFNGSRQQAQMFIDLGFRLGFGGAMSFAGSSRIRELARTLPLSAIVLETDAPDMAPAWGQGERNLPANLARYAALLAELRGNSLEEVVGTTGRNVREVLGGWTPG